MWSKLCPGSMSILVMILLIFSSLFYFFLGIHSHTSSATPFSIPLAVSQQISQASTAQMQSSGSSDAEVAELAGASIEDSLEIEHIVRKREVMADRSRAADEVEKNLSLQDSSYSEEENVGAEGKL